MKKFFYFQTATAIEGTDTDEEAIMVPVDSLIAIEPATAALIWMHFEGKGLGDEDGATNLISVKLDVTAANFQEFCRQISLFCNASGTSGRWTKGGMLVVASEETGNTKFFHSTVTGCDTIQIKTAAA